jgi:hypothetical protein
MTMDSVHRLAGTTTIDATTFSSSSTSAAPSDAPPLLPEPSGGLGDDAYANLAMLLTRADQADAKDASNLQQVADQAATQEDNERVTKMREKADKDEAQGIASGIGDIVGGAAAIAGACMSSGPSAADGAKGAASAESAAAPASTGSFFSKIDWRNGLANGVKPVATGTGGLVAGVFKGDGDRAEAEAARHEANAKANERRSGEMQQRVTDANNSIQRVEQFLEQIQQTLNATRLAAATRA